MVASFSTAGTVVIGRSTGRSKMTDLCCQKVTLSRKAIGYIKAPAGGRWPGLPRSWMCRAGAPPLV